MSEGAGICFPPGGPKGHVGSGKGALDLAKHVRAGDGVNFVGERDELEGSLGEDDDGVGRVHAHHLDAGPG